MVIGLAAGLLIDLFGVLGLALFIAVGIVSAFFRPRFTLLAGVLVGAGGLWLPFATGASVLCAAIPSSCTSTSPLPFALVAATVLLGGLLPPVWSQRRLRRSRDIRRR